MTRLNALNPEEATGKSKELFDSIKSKMGLVPNMMRTMGNSTPVLEGYANFSKALGNASLGGKLSELIAIAIATANGCDYCNAAHTFVATKMGLDDQSIELARSSVSKDTKVNAALQFAKEVFESRGQVTNTAFVKIRAAGFDDAAITEIIAAVALNVFTNYINNAAQTEIDFPKLSPINQN